jgi:hypothetical protein
MEADNPILERETDCAFALIRPVLPGLSRIHPASPGCSITASEGPRGSGSRSLRQLATGPPFVLSPPVSVIRVSRLRLTIGTFQPSCSARNVWNFLGSERTLRLLLGTQAWKPLRGNGW